VLQPTRLLSPATVLRLQQGHCFEYSTVLASLLIGVGYDAYVVSGYATKEICLMDETRETCPMMKPIPEVQHGCLSSHLPDLYSVADQWTAYTPPPPAYSPHAYLLTQKAVATEARSMSRTRLTVAINK